MKVIGIRLLIFVAIIVPKIQSFAVDTAKFVRKNPNLIDPKHGIRMGHVSPDCDDAKNNLNVDWNQSPINYTCYQRRPYRIDKQIKPLIECEPISADYMPQHFCTKDPINYNHSLPTYGDHRPLWPVFGEYRFVPPQRWLHNVEHGAIIMLYHPCTNPMQVDKLRTIVTNCIRKHVITADSYRLDSEWPLALIAWGCRMRMNYVDSRRVINFIRQHALHGPEGKLSKEGQYTHLLLSKAKIPIGSSHDDDILCPFSF